VEPATSPRFDHEPVQGVPYHTLLITDEPWVHHRHDAEDSAPHHTPEELRGYIESCMKGGGAVTVNLGIYQDGRMGDRALEVMRAVRRQIRGC